MRKTGLVSVFMLAAFLFLCMSAGISAGGRKAADKKWLTLDSSDIKNGAHHTEHFKIFSKYTSGYNLKILKAIDKVQSHAMDGGKYFIGIDSVPAESPVYYELKLFNKSLINPPRKSSYCSGSSYTVFIEAINEILKNKSKNLSDERYEALRMQETDGGRRNDWVKFWGIWNADGFGSHYALVQYADMASEIKPEDARPGDFVNISWKSGIGHSVVFLGWYKDKDNKKSIVYWSSQKGTNGYGDQISPLEKVKNVKFVRLSKPGNLFKFDINKAIDRNIKGDQIDWQ